MGCGDSEGWAEWFSGAASFLAVVVALVGYWLADCQRRFDLKRSDIALAHAVQIKLKSCISYTENLREDVTSYAIEGGKSSVHTSQMWQMVKPPPSLLDDAWLNLSNAELDFLMRIKEYDFLEQLQLAIRKYHTAVSILREYKAQRDDLLSKLPHPYESDGVSVSISLNKEEKIYFDAKGAALSALITNAKFLLDENASNAEELIFLLSEALTRQFPEQDFAKLVMKT